MIAFPPAKINLGLHILRKRADGYHDLSTCFYPIQWCDVLEVIPSGKLTFESSGLPIPGNENDNLCLKAYQLVARDHSIPPVQIYLHKIIPMGAGLGGGSSDGAWTLRLLNTVFDLNLTQEKLKTYAAQLGSDCAIFMEDGPAMGSSRGEILTPTTVSLKGKWIVVVKPEIHVSTADAFAGIIPQLPSKDLQVTVETLPVEKWKDVIKNDFETTVFAKHPVIRSVKEKLYALGATYASMSGSGSAVFGLFEKETDLRPEFPEMAYWAGKI